ncbi:MAG: porin [Balneolaceae bacterium]
MNDHTASVATPNRVTGYQFFTASLALLILFLAGPVQGQESGLPDYRSPEIIRTENYSMTLGSRLQIRYLYQNLEESDDNSSFGIRRARLSLSGNAYSRFRYAMQLGLAGGSVNLLDANIRYEFTPMVTLWAGQGKALFGRQQLTSSGNLHFVDRTAVDGRFSAGRQAGVALTGQNESQTFEYGIGIYNGNGINSANDNGKHMKVARVVLTPFGAYSPSESAHDYPDSPRLAIGFSGLHTTSGSGDSETEIKRINSEAAFKVHGFNVTGEYYWEESSLSGSSNGLNTNGWYLQGGYLLPDRKNEIALRYAAISPDTNTNTDRIETGVAFSHYFMQHRAKIQADIRSLEQKVIDTRDVEFRIQLQISL